MKRWLFKRLMKWFGYEIRIKLQNQYWPGRWDTMMMSDFVTTNHIQQQAFPVVTSEGEHIYCQPGHYTEYEFLHSNQRFTDKTE
jgi:hypothetical protein